MTFEPRKSARLAPFGTTVFSEITALAIEHQAINLAQGFPDFEGPNLAKENLARAIADGHHQYCRSQGHLRLCEAVAELRARHFGLEFDPQREVIAFHGATEGIAAALLGLLSPGDEVIVFEPFYDSYPACLALADSVPVFHTLEYPDFAVDFDRLRSQISPRTRAILLNTPHNPTGKVFTVEELERLATLCLEHDLFAITDEVYEYLTFDGAQHQPLALIPGMRERTLSLSSAGKTLSFTGWKVGWGVGPEPMVSAAQAAHQYLTFCGATPLQVAVGDTLRQLPETYYEEFRRDYSARRQRLLELLRRHRFDPVAPEGTYFVLTAFDRISTATDREFVKRMVREAGVAAIPPSSFYRSKPEEGAKLLRFAFCKDLATLDLADQRLEAMV